MRQNSFGFMLVFSFFFVLKCLFCIKKTSLQGPVDTQHGAAVVVEVVGAVTDGEDPPKRKFLKNCSTVFLRQIISVLGKRVFSL
jgi:hypothetical protein